MSNNGLSSNAQPANGEGAAGPRRRKIDRSEWPTLLARRQAGATQAQIAQDYGVSQGTVSQILKRARAEAEGQPVADLDGDAASEVEANTRADASDSGAPAAVSGSASASADVSSGQDAAADSAQVRASADHAPANPAPANAAPANDGPANDAATPRRTLTTRSRTAGQSAPSAAAATPAAGAPASTPAQRDASAPDAASGDDPAQSGDAVAGAGKSSGNPLADRLREASERCAQLVDQKATSDTLSSAVHEVRRALAAIEIDAAKQNSPAAQRPRPAPPTRPASQSASAPAQPPARAPEPFEPPRREPGVDSSKAAGRVKFFKPEKGFGFIIPDDGGDDIFVGKDTVQAAGIDRLSEGDRVRYTPGPGAKGLEAKTIERIG